MGRWGGLIFLEIDLGVVGGQIGDEDLPRHFLLTRKMGRFR